MKKFKHLKSFLFAAFFSTGICTHTVSCQVKPSQRIEDFVGRFETSGNFTFEFAVFKEGDHLIIQSSGKPAATFIPVSETKFINKDKAVFSIEFITTNNNKPCRAVLIQDGVHIEARRKEVKYEPYELFKKYPVKQLKEDFGYFRTILEKYHPSVYEFTPKKDYDKHLDSLNASIKAPMDEVEFRNFLLPAIARIHSGHTGISPSKSFEAYRSLLKYPPFKLFYEGNRAFLQYYVGKPQTLQPGIEVLAINDIPVKNIIKTFVQKVSSDGIQTSAQYFALNDRIGNIFVSMADYYKAERYKLTLINNKTDYLEAVNFNEFKQMADLVKSRKLGINFLQSTKTAILTLPTFRDDQPGFIEDSFRKLKESNTENLVIDLRGNGGGPPKNGVELTRHLLDRDFYYYSKNVKGFSEYKNLIKVSGNIFNGQVFFLIDGGCNSTTGHFLSLMKYYNRGKFIGENSPSNYSCTNNGAPYSLPNSNLILNCPSVIVETAVTGFKKGEGIKPDFEVKENITSILSGKDKVLEFCLKLISQNKP